MPVRCLPDEPERRGSAPAPPQAPHGTPSLAPPSERAVALAAAHGCGPVSEALAEEAEGIPFFICELAQSVAKRSNVVRAWAERPLSIEEQVLRRIAALSPRAQTLLDTLCVAGGPLELGVAELAQPTRVVSVAQGQQARAIVGGALPRAPALP